MKLISFFFHFCCLPVLAAQEFEIFGNPNVHRVFNIFVHGHQNLKVWLPETSYMTYYKKEVIFGRKNASFTWIGGIPKFWFVMLDVFEDGSLGRYKFVSQPIKLVRYVMSDWIDIYEPAAIQFDYRQQLVFYGYKKDNNIVMTEPIAFYREGDVPSSKPAKDIIDVMPEDNPDLQISIKNVEIFVPFDTIEHAKTISVNYGSIYTSKVDDKPYLSNPEEPKFSHLKRPEQYLMVLHSNMTLTTGNDKKFPVLASFAVSIQGSTPDHAKIEIQWLWRLVPRVESLESWKAVSNATSYFAALSHNNLRS